MGGVDEALIAAGRLQVLADPAELPLRKRTTPVGVLHPRDPRLLVDAAARRAIPVGVERLVLFPRRRLTDSRSGSSEKVKWNPYRDSPQVTGIAL